MKTWSSFDEAGERAVMGDYVATDEGPRTIIAVLDMDDRAEAENVDARFRVAWEVFDTLNEGDFAHDFWSEVGAKIVGVGATQYVFLAEPDAAGSAAKAMRAAKNEVCYFVRHSAHEMGKNAGSRKANQNSEAMARCATSLSNLMTLLKKLEN